jgi:hypothetical protein
MEVHNSRQVHPRASAIDDQLRQGGRKVFAVRGFVAHLYVMKEPLEYDVSATHPAGALAVVLSQRKLLIPYCHSPLGCIFQRCATFKVSVRYHGKAYIVLIIFQ